MYIYSFENDSNEELIKIQEFIYYEIRPQWDIFYGAKAILICACNSINTKESQDIAKFALDFNQFDEQIFESSFGVISAIYRYKFGSKQIEFSFDNAHNHSKESYLNNEKFKLYFREEPIQWYHFKGFLDFYKSIVNNLLKYTDFVAAVNLNTIFRPMNNFQEYINDQLISDSIFNIYNIKEVETLKLDFSSMEEIDVGWKYKVHPNPGRFNADFLF